MEQVTLRAESRSDTGSRAARRMRRDGAVPAVLYGRGLDPQIVAVDRRELYAALHTGAGANALINLEVEGAKKPFLTVAREIQRHPVRGEIAHLDFINISLDEKITAEVGIEFMGTPLGVREHGAIMETIRTSVNVEALPLDVPANVTVDVTDLDLGTTLKVGDLPELEGVEYLDDPDADLVTVVIPRVVEVEEPEVDEELAELLEGEEGAEGAAEEGAAEEGAEPEAEEEA